MVTAVIYARYSCDNQTEQSIEGQLRVCRDYAEKNDILVIDTYIDRAMTGTNDNRPEFRRMIDDSKKKKFDCVLVYKLDRFSRNRYESVIHKKTLRDNKVKLVSAMEHIPDGPEGTMFESFLEAYNQYYSDELSQKVKRGMRETRLKGKYQGGWLPYGYFPENGRIVIDESKAETVRFIYEQYDKGVSVDNIIKALDEKSVLYRGKKFQRSAVYFILTNEKYSGVYRFGNEVYENMFPPIISKELFASVKKIRSQNNKSGSHSVKVTYLFRNKLICGYCGSPISAECGTTKNGEVKRYYKCYGRKTKHNGCTKSQVRKELFEEFIMNAVIKEMNNPKFKEKMIDELLKAQENDVQENTTLKMLIKEQEGVQMAIDNLVSAVERGIISNSTNKRLHDLEEQQEKLAQQVLIEQNKTTSKLTRKDIEKYYDAALKHEPQLIVRYLIDHIVLYDDRVQIYFTSPLNGSPDESRGFYLYETKGYLKYQIQNQRRLKNREMMIVIIVK